MLERLPNPRGETRRRLARERRRAAVEAAHRRGQPQQPVNGELVEFDGIWPTSYSKGLPHDARTGLVAPDAFERFVKAVNEANQEGAVFRFDVPIGPEGTVGGEQKGHRPAHYMDRPGDAKQFSFQHADGRKVRVRNWESPRAGHVYDLEGPDAAALAMSSFPKLGSDELIAEMAELYAMAFLRDVPVVEFENGGAEAKVDTALAALNALPWFSGEIDGLTPAAARRRAARLQEQDDTGSPDRLDRQTLFRGSAPGAKVGPFVSQFLLIGNQGRRDPMLEAASRVSFNAAPLQVPGGRESTGLRYRSAEIEDGYILWGTQRIDQRMTVQKSELDYLGDWPAWLDVQNGADFRGLDRFEDKPRFATTLRDLTSFVHFDALYQAYLNAFLILAGFEARFDVGLPSGQNHPTRGSFATFGAPHFQTLLTEVSSRALKAVRRQKFNWQLRGRPEYLGAMLSLAASDSAKLGPARGAMVRMVETLRNAGVFALQVESQVPAGLVPADGVTPPVGPAEDVLLRQAFPEGSPMHPSYGAGHATVAGACVTILKACFQTYVDPRPVSARNPLGSGHVPVDFRQPEWWLEKLTLSQVGVDLNESGDRIGGSSPKLLSFYHPPVLGADPDVLRVAGDAADLTVIGELNKLAANIAIARNIAGVHYYIDYYASLRLGERVAVGILEEQLLSYPEPVAMRFESFDGDRIVISGDGDGGTVRRHAFDADHAEIDYDEWWSRHFVD